MAGNVGPLGGQEGGIGRLTVGPRGHEVAEALLHLVEAFLIFPQGVIGIDAEYGQHPASLGLMAVPPKGLRAGWGSGGVPVEKQVRKYL